MRNYETLKIVANKKIITQLTVFFFFSPHARFSWYLGWPRAMFGQLVLGASHAELGTQNIEYILWHAKHRAMNECQPCRATQVMDVIALP